MPLTVTHAKAAAYFAEADIWHERPEWPISWSEPVKIVRIFDSTANHACTVYRSGDILFVDFDGSTTVTDWMRNFELARRKQEWLPSDVTVHSGFDIIFRSMWPSVISAIDTQFDTTPFDSLVVCGHSQGGALAMMACARLAVTWEHMSTIELMCVTISSPKAGNEAWANWYDQNVPETWRIVTSEDMANQFPPYLFGYHHAGKEVEISTYNPEWRMCSHKTSRYGGGDIELGMLASALPIGIGLIVFLIWSVYVIRTVSWVNWVILGIYTLIFSGLAMWMYDADTRHTGIKRLVSNSSQNELLEEDENCRPSPGRVMSSVILYTFALVTGVFAFASPRPSHSVLVPTCLTFLGLGLVASTSRTREPGTV